MDDDDDDTFEVEEFGPRRLTVDLEAIGIPDDESLDVPKRDREFDEEETIEFLNLICDDWGEFEAGLSLGWSPQKIKRFVTAPDRRELIWAIREAENESVERSIKNTAKRGNPAAQRLWAFNKMSHRGWADRKSLRVEGEIDHGVVVSVKQALDEQTRELIEASNAEGVAALQRAIGLGDDPEEIIDAELVE